MQRTARYQQLDQKSQTAGLTSSEREELIAELLGDDWTPRPYVRQAAELSLPDREPQHEAALRVLDSRLSSGLGWWG